MAVRVCACVAHMHAWPHVSGAICALSMCTPTPTSILQEEGVACASNTTRASKAVRRQDAHMRVVDDCGPSVQPFRDDQGVISTELRLQRRHPATCVPEATAVCVR